jgi:hypothetical protein
VPVASPASTFFQSGDLPNAARPNPRPVGAFNSIVPCFMCNVRLKFMVGSSLKKSLRRLDDGEDCRFEWGWKFFPSGDYLGQFGA